MPEPDAFDPNPVPALMAIQACALSARTGQLTLHMVDDARTKAEELLPRDHAARTAMIRFATGYEELRRDEYGLRKLGEQLQDQLGAALNPDAPTPRRHPYGGGDDD